MSAETEATNFYLPAELKKRAKVVAKRIGSTLSDLIRAALLERVETFEAKFHAEEERKRQEVERKRQARTLRPLGDPLAPKRSTLAPAAFEARPPAELGADEDEGKTSVERAPADLAELYYHHARRILEKWDDVAERRLRLGEAVADIKRQAPLRCPPDDEIRALVEAALVEIRDREKPPAPLVDPAGATPPLVKPLLPVLRIIDDKVGKIINPLSVPSLGDVDDKPTERGDDE